MAKKRSRLQLLFEIRTLEKAVNERDQIGRSLANDVHRLIGRSSGLEHLVHTMLETSIESEPDVRALLNRGVNGTLEDLDKGYPGGHGPLSMLGDQWKTEAVSMTMGEKSEDAD